MRCWLGCLLSLSTLAIGVVAHEFCIPMEASEAEVRGDQGLPCYVLISDQISDYTELREVTILVDRYGINEGNFVRLLRHFSAMYSDGRDFSVKVKTSLDFTMGQYTTTEDLELMEAGLPPKPKIWEKAAQGILTRIGDVERFGYKAEGGDFSDMKYVLVKGDDPNCAHCKRLEADSRYSGSGEVVESSSTSRAIPCYYVIGNSVDNHRRFVGLIINAQDGNESNLLAVLRHLSRQYPKPDPLVIKVYTERKQSYDFLVPTVGEYIVPAMAQHFAAVLFREGRNLLIRYRRPHEDVTTVVVEGTDIFPSLDYAGTRAHRSR